MVLGLGVFELSKELKHTLSKFDSQNEALRLDLVLILSVLQHFDLLEEGLVRGVLSRHVVDLSLAIFVHPVRDANLGVLLGGLVLCVKCHIHHSSEEVSAQFSIQIEIISLHLNVDIEIGSILSVFVLHMLVQPLARDGEVLVFESESFLGRDLQFGWRQCVLVITG